MHSAGRALSMLPKDPRMNCLSLITRRFAPFVALLALAATAAAQSSPFNNRPGQDFGGFGDSRDRVNVYAQAAATDVTPGTTVPVAVVLDHRPMWHSWPPEGVTIDGAAEFAGAIRTNVTPVVPAGSPLTPHTSQIQWPEPHLVQASLLGEPQQFAVLEGRAVVYVPVTVAADATPGEAPLSFNVTFQSCDDKTCMKPVFDHSVSVALNIVAGDPIAASEFAAGDVFDGFDASGVQAHPNGTQSTPDPVPAPPPGGYGDSRDEVIVSVHAAARDVTPGSQLPIAVVYDHSPKWHTWPPEGVGIEGADLFSGALYTTLVPQLEDASVQAHTGFLQSPAPHLVAMDLDGTGVPKQLAVMEGKAAYYIPFTVDEDAAPGETTIRFTTTFQSCDDTQCLVPAFDVEYSTTINIIEGEPMRATEMDLTGVFADFDATVFQKIAGGETPPEQPANTAASAPPPSVLDGVTTTGPNFFGIQLPSTEGPVGLLILALMSALGGFILNLTPCVLPVIPIKVLTISQHAGTPGKSLVLGLWMALGVVAFWFAIGLPVAFLSSVTDPSRIFGIWWLTLGIGVLIGAMGIGIMGLFQFRIPNSLYAINPKADNAWGSFLFGVMTAVLGLPCFGFVAGALLAGAATLPAMSILVIFISIGVGMAAPYLVLAAKPSLVDSIPRTGPASELVKQVMGLLLLAAAAYFIGSGLVGLVTEQPYLGKQLHWWAVALFAGLSAFWLIVRTFAITKRVGPRITFLITGIIVGGVAILYAADSTAKAREIYAIQQEANEHTDTGITTKTWNNWTPAKFEQARNDGYTLVLDFTAEWCLICKSLKATVLNREPVRPILEGDDVVMFTVDLTSLKDPGWDFLRDLGGTGIPMLAVFKPDASDPWMSNAYTPQQVLDALDWARTTQVARND